MTHCLEQSYVMLRMNFFAYNAACARSQGLLIMIVLDTGVQKFAKAIKSSDSQGLNFEGGAVKSSPLNLARTGDLEMAQQQPITVSRSSN